MAWGLNEQFSRRQDECRCTNLDDKLQMAENVCFYTDNHILFSKSLKSKILKRRQVFKKISFKGKKIYHNA